MEINNFFEQISSFWTNIYPIILLHIIFYLCFKFVFGSPQLLGRINRFTNTQRYTILHDNLDKFELWKKLPILLGIAALVYLAVFNSVASVIGDLPIPFFHLKYTESDLIREAGEWPSVKTIAAYSPSVNIDPEKIRMIKDNYLTFYQSRFPDDFSHMVEWTRKAQAEKSRDFIFALVFGIAFLFCLVRVRSVFGWWKKIFRTFILITGYAAACFYLRIQTEHAIERRVSGELNFVANHLMIDSLPTPLREPELTKLNNNYQHYLADEWGYRPHTIWYSRYIDKNSWLNLILGDRPIKQ